MIPAFSPSCASVFRQKSRSWTSSKKKLRFSIPTRLPVSPRCCINSLDSNAPTEDSENQPTEDSTTQPAEREISIVAVSMTAGGEVLFPGTRLDVEVPFEAAMRASDAVNSEFGYLPIDAWNVPSSVGTVCVVDEFATSKEGHVNLRANGLERFRLVSLAADRERGIIAPFCDDPVPAEDAEAVGELESELIEAMQEIVRLTLKIGGQDELDATHQMLLSETLRRVEAFCTQEKISATEATNEETENKADVGVLEQWGSELNAGQRREILSFAVLDLLNLSFMSRRSLMMGVDTRQRLEDAIEALKPYLKQLAAKGAIVSALGKEDAA